MTVLSVLVGGALSPNPVTDLDQLTAYPFMVNALEGGTAVAVMAGVVGWFMVLRRESFAGHTMSVMAFPGAAGALLIGLPAAPGYFVACALAALAIGRAPKSGTVGGRGHESALIGTVQALGLACGFLFLTLYNGFLAGYESLLFGTFLGITRAQVLTLVVVCAVTVAFFVVVGRPLLFASVDEAVARAGGVPTRALGLAFLLVLGLAVAATAQITGVLLVFSLLVAPAATAQLVTPRLGASLALTVALAVAIAWVGLALAYFYDYPVGFYVTSVAFGVYLVVRIARAVHDRQRLAARGARVVGARA